MGIPMRNRLHSLCPYFAMFPETFVEQQLESYSRPGDSVFDPFSGRGTTLLQALLMKRRALATDINPVAYCISAAKAAVPSLPAVLSRIEELQQRYEELARTDLEEERLRLPAFFHRAFYHTTLRQLLFLRSYLNWKSRGIDRFIAALTLGCLHGNKSPNYLSNQMPRTISTKPEYSINYWRERHLWPQKRNAFSFLEKWARLRLSGDRPPLRGSVAMADARTASIAFERERGRVKVIVTSPPYYSVTRYEEDQWLRLWFLGHEPGPTYGLISKDDRYYTPEKYWRFLREVWEGISDLTMPRAIMVCRLGAVGISQSDLTDGLLTTIKSAFPRASLTARPRLSKIRKRQTECFLPGTDGCLYEKDYSFRLS